MTFDSASRLGRSAVVGPGDPAPPGWEACERVAVVRVHPERATELHAAWQQRRPLVIEVAPGAGLDDSWNPPPDRVEGRQPWEWSPGLVLPAETLHHAVWANSVDARGGRPPVWRWAVEARRLGAGPGDESDVTLADGSPAVCDGGPLDASLAGGLGLAVLHRVSIEHGSLQPLLRSSPVGLGLAPDQLAAVGEPRAGARVIAPAGSGKTRVLTERARLLAGGWGLPPSAMALVAYNVRASAEMADRLTGVPGMRIRTLNSLALRLCGRSRTIGETEVRRILSGLVDFPRRAETDPAAPWIEALSRVRLGLADPVDVEDDLPDVSDLERVARTYREKLRESREVDFDEQITAAIERLLGDPAFRARSQRFARVLLVDEFQDLTPAHVLLLRLLSGPAGAVFGVGDDDQTIYGYSGASPRWLIDFERWFPGSASHALEVNYRCPPEVVTAAANVLSHNAVRVPKRIVAGSPGTGGAVTVLRGAEGPARRASERVAEVIAAGAAPSDVAVLSRVNASLVPVSVLLSHLGMPVSSRGERNFLDRRGVRAALAWLSVASAPTAALPAAALQEAARRPKRGFSNGLVELIGRSRRLDGLEGLVGWLDRKGSDRDAAKVEDFVADVARVRRAAAGAGTAAVLRAIRLEVGLDDSASALDAWTHGAIAAHLDDLEALSELAELEPDPARFPAWLAERLAGPTDPTGVTLASVHSVKGREWPHVIVHHVTDGLMPHRLARDAEEERRVFHVAITRAVRSLSLVPGTPASPFLAEMEEPGQPARPPARPPTRSQPKAAPAATKAAERAPDLLAAAPGTTFRLRGHEHEVVEVTAAGVMCRLGGSPAVTAVRLGTTVDGPGGRAVLSHPASPAALGRLKQWRSEKAKALGKPAYVIFDDRTLRELAVRLPTTEAALLGVPGIGPVKLDSYGSDLISLAERLRSDHKN